MCNHLNLKILIHIFTIIYLIIIIMRGENFVVHLDGLGGTTVVHHWSTLFPDLEADLILRLAYDRSSIKLDIYRDRSGTTYES
jgi:hypothetical protein